MFSEADSGAGWTRTRGGDMPAIYYRKTAKKTETKTNWKLESDNELYWNVADIATFKDGKRTNLHAPCTSSSVYTLPRKGFDRTCNQALNGLPKDAHGNYEFWSPHWEKEKPTYWIKWDSPASADTIKIFQFGHPHSRAKLTYGDQVCELNLIKWNHRLCGGPTDTNCYEKDTKKRRQSYETFKLADVCKTKRR
jgi:hypothetical protein